MFFSIKTTAAEGTSAAAASSNAKNTNTDFSPYYQAGAVACYLLVALPFCGMITIPSIDVPLVQAALMLWFLAAGVLGYAIQRFGAKILHIERKPMVFSYEDRTKRYRLHEALFCHVAAVLIAMLASRAAWAILYRYAAYYGEYSVYPYAIALCTFFMVEFGGYLWFIPYNTLISMPRLGAVGFTLLCTFLLEKLLGFRTTYAVLTATNYLSLIPVISLFVLILNQAFITRPYGGKIARGINDAAKTYSARIVALALSCVALGTVVTMSVLVAVVKGWYAVLKFLLAQLVSRKTGGDEDEIKAVLEQDMAGELLELRQGQADYWVVVFVILTVIVIAFLLVLWIPSLREKAKELLLWLKEVFLFLFRSPSELRQKKQRRESLNFVDTEEKTRHPVSRIQLRTDDLRSYAEFERRLDTLENIGDKIRYAYAVTAVLLQDQRCDVKKSDTPREIAGKVKKRELIPDIDPLTGTFEHLHYENAPPPPDSEQTLARLCVIVQNYL